MKQPYKALADLVGQLLAQRWIQEQELDQRDTRLDTKRPTCRQAEPPSQNQDNEEDV